MIETLFSAGDGNPDTRLSVPSQISDEKWNEFVAHHISAERIAGRVALMSPDKTEREGGSW